MEEFIFFHDFTLIVLVFIISFVFYLIGGLIVSPWVHRGLLEGQVLERIWTVIPAVILLQVAIPSLLLLYILDETASCSLTLKAVGHQWY